MKIYYILLMNKINSYDNSIIWRGFRIDNTDD